MPTRRQSTSAQSVPLARPLTKPVATTKHPKKPLARKPLAKKPLAKKPLAKKPLATKPLATKPLATKPLAKPAPSVTRVPPTPTRAVVVPKPGMIPQGAGMSPYELAYHGAPLGAHVSTAGGVVTAPPRGVDIGATAIQLFTKQASQWKERQCSESEVSAFRDALARTTITFATAHDSYLINLASPDVALRAKSLASFEAELRRSNALGLDAVVSHPGNFMDDRASGLARNADAITEALERVPGPTRLLMELTAGQGTVLGSTFEEMADLLGRLPTPLQARVGVCFDTAHVYASGYDLAHDFDGVMSRFDDVIGFGRLGLFHLNDSKAPLASKKDRHEMIGLGAIGEGAFRRLMTDQRFATVPKLLETPKGDDMITNDRRMLRRLRVFAGGR